MLRRTVLCCGSGVVALVAAMVLADPGGPPSETPGPGKSAHGAAFNEGPRQAAPLLQGTGRVSFPISTRSPQAQAFFNQGIGQLHGYWFFEAERSFRQAAALDPTAAMAYWGMAVANFHDDKRGRDFIAQAVKRKANVTALEAEWIDALADYFTAPPGDDKARRRGLIQALERLCYRHPDDLEARAFLVWFLWDNHEHGVPIDSTVAVNALIDQVLAAEPLHPIHHFRLHLTPAGDDAGSRSRVLASAAKCARAAPAVPHMWHMPSHAYSDLRRFADAVYHQEAALRVEHAHLTRMKMMPDESFLYVHNRSWLLDNLSHVGRVRDALELAKFMIELPRHPRFGQAAAAEGRRQLLDLCRRHELWNELLALEGTDFIEPTADRAEQVRRALTFGAAHFATGNRSRGEALMEQVNEIKKQARADRQAEVEKLADQAQRELMGYQALAAGNVSGALTWLEADDSDNRDLLSRLYLQAKDPVKANALSNDTGGRVTSLANRVEVLYRLGRTDDARKAFDQLRRLAERADLNLPALRRLQPVAREFGYPDDWRLPMPTASDVGERPDLEQLGPTFWQPWTAPAWRLSDIDGRTRSLDEFRGRPVVLICYLGVGCIHCVQQLRAFSALAAKFQEANIALVAVGDDPLELMQRSRDAAEPGLKLPLILLSDVKHDLFRAYGAFDDFENKPLHGTFLIDGSGRVRWQDVGADPFSDAEFLLGEAKRLLRQPEVRRGYPPGVKAAATLTPLPEMTAAERYKGQDGGLYGGGRNSPPAEHLKRALDEAARLAPLDRDGKPDAGGQLVLLGLGGGQAGEIFGRFKTLVDADPARPREVVVVDGTQWDQDLAAWATVARRLSGAGVSDKQVQGIWLHVAPETPEKAAPLHEKLAQAVAGFRERFPNLRLVWLSSGVYAGHALDPRKGEPLGYDSAWVVRGVILEQVRGSERLGQAPPLLWGPYLWGDGQAWRREDFLADGSHLSQAGRDKAAARLLRFFKEDVVARGWFR